MAGGQAHVFMFASKHADRDGLQSHPMALMAGAACLIHNLDLSYVGGLPVGKSKNGPPRTLRAVVPPEYRMIQSGSIPQASGMGIQVQKPHLMQLMASLAKRNTPVVTKPPASEQHRIVPHTRRKHGCLNNAIR